MSKTCLPYKQTIILSHVSSHIPSPINKDYIKNELNLNLTSNISILRVNPHNLLFDHIISRRRQFYTDTEINDDKFPIPS